MERETILTYANPSSCRKFGYCQVVTGEHLSNLLLSLHYIAVFWLESPVQKEKKMNIRTFLKFHTANFFLHKISPHIPGAYMCR